MSNMLQKSSYISNKPIPRSYTTIHMAQHVLFAHQRHGHPPVVGVCIPIINYNEPLMVVG